MAFRSLASTQVDGNVTINAPAGLANGDVLLIAVSTDAAPASFGTTPSGLTVLAGPTSFSSDNQNVILYGCIWNGTQSLSFTPTSSADNIYLAVAFSGRDGSAIGTTATVTTTTPAGPSTAIALTGATAAAGDDIAAFSMPDPVTTATTQTPPAGYTEPSGADLDSATHISTLDFAYKENVSAGATGTLTFTASHSVEYTGWVVRLAVGGGPNITSQPSDAQTAVGGTETFSVTASASGGGTLSYQWKLNGTNVSTGSGGTTSSYTTGTLALSDNGGSYTCDVTETGGTNDGTTTSSAAIGYVGIRRVAIGAAAFSTSGGTSVAPAYPTLAANDLLILQISQKPSSANGGTVTTPAGWTLENSRTGANDGDTGGYTTTLASNTGNVNILTYSKVATGSESGTLSVTVGTNNVCAAQITSYRAPSGYTFSTGSTTGKDTTGNSTLSLAGSADPGVTAGDWVIGSFADPTSVPTFSAEAFSQTGVTFGTVTEVLETSTTVGNRCGLVVWDALATAGTSSAAPTWSGTVGGTATNARGPGTFLRLRPIAPAATNIPVRESSGPWQQDLEERVQRRAFFVIPAGASQVDQPPRRSLPRTFEELIPEPAARGRSPVPLPSGAATSVSLPPALRRLPNESTIEERFARRLLQVPAMVLPAVDQPPIARPRSGIDQSVAPDVPPRLLETPVQILLPVDPPPLGVWEPTDEPVMPEDRPQRRLAMPPTSGASLPAWQPMAPVRRVADERPLEEPVSRRPERLPESVDAPLPLALRTVREEAAADTVMRRALALPTSVDAPPLSLPRRLPEELIEERVARRLLAPPQPAPADQPPVQLRRTIRDDYPVVEERQSSYRWTVPQQPASPADQPPRRVLPRAFEELIPELPPRGRSPVPLPSGAIVQAQPLLRPRVGISEPLVLDEPVVRQRARAPESVDQPILGRAMRPLDEAAYEPLPARVRLPFASSPVADAPVPVLRRTIAETAPVEQLPSRLYRRLPESVDLPIFTPRRRPREEPIVERPPRAAVLQPQPPPIPPGDFPPLFFRRLTEEPTAFELQLRARLDVSGFVGLVFVRASDFRRASLRANPRSAALLSKRQRTGSLQ